MILLTLLLLAACPSSKNDSSDSDTDPIDTGDPPALCQDGPHEATECGFEKGIPNNWNYRRMQNEKEGVDVIVVREPVGMGSGETTKYACRGFALVKDGCLYCVNDSASLAYTTGHHNWYDDADATIDGVRHRAHMEFQPSDPDDPMSEWVWSFALSGIDPKNEAVLWGPIPLVLTDGMKW